jgi:hypothetical protein
LQSECQLKSFVISLLSCETVNTCYTMSIILSTMTPEELDVIKIAFGRLQEVQKEAWLERVLLRNLIVDSGLMTEAELDSAIQWGKNHPGNLRQMELAWAESDQKLAEIGLADWLAWFEDRYPRSG